MKIITFQGGLGNQLFEFNYYLYLKSLFPNETFYSYFPTSGLISHNGLEIQKWFELELPPETRFTTIISEICVFLDKIERHFKLPFHSLSRDSYLNHDKLLHFGIYQDCCYLMNNYQFKFRNDISIGRDNEKWLQLITQTQSVAVHVRRNDYLAPAIKHIYGGICTDDYYKRAINEIKKRVNNPVFFFFSDDQAFVEEHFDLDNKYVVSCNKKERSFFDLYLMSHCKNMILANSTFSWWAAYLNKGVEHVFCPIRWNNLFPYPNLKLDRWEIMTP